MLPSCGDGSAEEALTLANDSNYGLSAYVFSQNYSTVMKTVEDLDFGGITAVVVTHYAEPPEYAASHKRIGRSSEANAPDGGFDASFGVRLTTAFKDTGSLNIAGEVHWPLVADGTEKWASGIAEFLGHVLVGKGLTTSDIESFLAMTADAPVHYGSANMVTA